MKALFWVGITIINYWWVFAIIAGIGGILKLLLDNVSLAQ